MSAPFMKRFDIVFLVNHAKDLKGFCRCKIVYSAVWGTAGDCNTPDDKNEENSAKTKENSAIPEERRENTNCLPQILPEICWKFFGSAGQVECCEKTMTLNIAANCLVRGRPALSLGIYPIENMWSYFKIKL